MKRLPLPCVCLLLLCQWMFAASPAVAEEERKPGLLAHAYYAGSAISSLGEFDWSVQPNYETSVERISFDNPAGLGDIAGGRTERVFVRFFGQLHVPESGSYTLFLNSDDGSRLLLGGTIRINNDGLHGMTERQAELELEAGAHPIVVDYFNNTGGAGCIVSWQKAGGPKEVIPVSAFTYDAGDEPKLPEPVPFTIAKGDRITLIGNTLAERMQHDGWLETTLQRRFPDKELVIRNLGFSADAVDARLRVDGYGSQDEWLARTEADTIFVFFGFNESFAGEAGLSKFRNDLAGQVRRMLSQQYNGSSPPKIVLFSPIAHENLDDPNLPDGSESNERLALYSEAIAGVAGQFDLAYVDLFAPTLAAYQKSDKPLTINGVHLNSEGNRLLAGIIDSALFEEPLPETGAERIEKIRQAVLDKNFHWFNRYQPTDGFNVHGGRSGLTFGGITNRVVLQRENEVLEVMTANRDKRIWALAQGKDLAIDDSNTPEFIEVETNLPGPLPGGKHPYLGGEEAIEKMTLAPGMKVNLFACEEMFPGFINPVQMAFDTKGRLFVATWKGYTRWRPKDELRDKIVILEDTNGDGRADNMKVWADDLQNPTGFEFWGGGLLVACAPDVWFLKDTTGDDQADLRVRVLHGISSGDTHHAANSFVLDPGGALYFQEGTFHRTQVETPYGALRNQNGCVWRFEPRTWKLDRFIPYGFANPHGHVIDRWGQGIVHDGTGAVPYHTTLFSGHIDFPAHHGRAPVVYERRTRPVAATEILSSEHFPEENQGNLLVANVIGFRGVQQYVISDDESSLSGVEVDPIVSSDDPNFRPSDVEMGPDGAIYIADWCNVIIGHMQHHIRDPNRDDKHGRVYRVTYEGRPLMQSPDLTELTIEELLEQLKSPTDRNRYRARIELSDRPSQDVIAATRRWVSRLDTDAEEYEHHRLEALWLHQSHNVVHEELLKQVLASPDFRARAAATRVLCYWRDRVEDPLDLLQGLVHDEHPRVRLEAVRALSFFREAKAQEIALEVLIHPLDDYLKYTLDRTSAQLRKFSE